MGFQFIRGAILMRGATISIALLAVYASYEAAWVLTGRYGGVGALLYLAACLLSGVLIPVRFILTSTAAPLRRAVGLFVYLIALWASWTIVWGGPVLEYLDEHEVERWQTTLLFYGCTIGLPLIVALLIRTLLARLNHVPSAPAIQPHKILELVNRPGRAMQRPE